MNAVTVLRRPGIGRLAVAGLLTEVGDWMVFIALPLYVLELSRSPLVTATVFMLEVIPPLIAGPFAGVLIDRLDPWRLLATVMTAQAVTLLPLLLVQSADQIWIVYVVVAVEASLGTVIEPCRNATAAALTPADDLMPLNQALAVLSNVARLAGGPLGGLLLGFSGITGVVLGDAATFLIAAAVLYAGRRPRIPAADRRPAAPAAGRSGMVRAGSALARDWLDGIRIILRAANLRILLLVTVFMSLAQGAFVVLFVLFVLRDLHGNDASVGVLRGVQAVGAIAGAVPLSLVIARVRPNRLLTVSLLAFGIASLITWNAPLVTTTFAVYVALFIIAGIPGLAGATSHLTLLQTYAPPDSRGRVLSTVLAVSGGAQAIGMFVAGLVGTDSGLTVALQVQAIMYVIAALVVLRLPWPAGTRATKAAATTDELPVRDSAG